jgi:hypothetical protein
MKVALYWDYTISVVDELMSIEVEKKGNRPITGLYRPWGFQEFEAPGFLDNRHMKVVRLSAMCTGRIYSQQIFLGLNSVRGWVDPRAIVRPTGLCEPTSTNCATAAPTMTIASYFLNGKPRFLAFFGAVYEITWFWLNIFCDCTTITVKYCNCTVYICFYWRHRCMRIA